MLPLAPSHLVVKSGVLFEISSDDASGDMQVFNINTITMEDVKINYVIPLLVMDNGL
jgi:hypothetical protein